MTIVASHLDGCGSGIGERVGRSLATSVEGDHSREPAQRLHEGGELGEIPHQVDRASRLLNHDVERPISEHLEGEAATVSNGITHLDIPHDASLPE